MLLLFNSFDSALGPLKGGDFNKSTRSCSMNPRCPKTSPNTPGSGGFYFIFNNTKTAAILAAVIFLFSSRKPSLLAMVPCKNDTLNTSCF